MKQNLALPLPAFTAPCPETVRIAPARDQIVLQGRKRAWVRFRVRLHIFFLALASYHSVSKSIKAMRGFLDFNRKLHGDKGRLKIVQCGSKYYFGIYAPGYPSKIFDHYVKSELTRLVPIKKKTNPLSFVFFAITRKCPLQCEHCFEWDNLNKKETFNIQELKEIVDSFQKEGLSQFHLSGGEPLVRIRDVEELIRFGKDRSEFYVLTSGFNLTEENARRLKSAGATGVVISLDHFDPEQHNRFRGFPDAFKCVEEGVRQAQSAGLLVALTLCATREFTSWNNLMQYTELARSMGVAFIQVLEPKPVGHYAGKRVTLDWQQLELLEKFYTTLNYEKQYSDYPVILYHGYHQRRLGCMSAGNRNLYIDSAGYVNACPFCQTRDYHVSERLSGTKQKESHVEMDCPLYE